MLLRVGEVLIIQICNYNVLIKTLIIFVVFSFFKSDSTYSQKNSQKLTLINKNETDVNKLGYYLSLVYAEKNKDFERVPKYLTKLRDDIVDLTFIKRAFFSSLLIDDWQNTYYFAEKIIIFEPSDLFANIVISTNSYIEKDYLKSQVALKRLQNSDFVSYFNEIIISWIQLSIDDTKNDFLDKKGDECIPMVCLHRALMYSLLNEKSLAKKNFDKLTFGESQSHRIMEILLYFYQSINDDKKIKMIKESLEKDGFISRSYYTNDDSLNYITQYSHGLSELYFNISGWFYQKDMLEFAVYFSNISLKIRPDFRAQKILLSSIYEKLSLNSLALNALNGILDNDFYYLKASKLKIQILGQMQREKEITGLLNNLVFLFPRKNEFKVLLAKSLHNEKKYLDAIDYYSQVIEFNSLRNVENWDLYYSRGMSFERIKNWKKADKDFLKAIEINPEAAFVLNYLGYSWLERGVKLKKALEFISIASEILPNNGYIIDSLGWAYFLLGKYQKSIDILEHALKILPLDPTLNDHLGDAYWKVGREKEALSQWKRVLIFKSDYEFKKKIRKKISSGL